MFGSSSTTRTRVGVELALGMTTASTSLSNTNDGAGSFIGTGFQDPGQTAYPSDRVENGLKLIEDSLSQQRERLAEGEPVGGARQTLLPVCFTLGSQDPRHIVSVARIGRQYGG